MAKKNKKAASNVQNGPFVPMEGEEPLPLEVEDMITEAPVPLEAPEPEPEPAPVEFPAPEPDLDPQSDEPVDHDPREMVYEVMHDEPKSIDDHICEEYIPYLRMVNEALVKIPESKRELVLLYCLSHL